MESLENKTVIVGMSGGVDSSVSAALLKKQGAKVIGLFMNNWQEEKEGESICSSEKDFYDVESVCRHLSIDCYQVNFSKEYREFVFSKSLRDYKRGITPNPDILCNREIKFNIFFHKAVNLGADFVAMGHYCQKEKNAEIFRLKKGRDSGKDQTYFLYTIKEEILKRILFPIGHLHKSEVRKKARQYELATAEKKDSTGLCFVGEKKFRPFLSRYIKSSPGPLKTLSGKVVGRHDGLAYYTIGQRKGLGLGGPGEAWFVVEKNRKENTVFVERGSKHPALYTEELWTAPLEWINKRDQPQEFPYRCRAKIRYRQNDQDCSILSLNKKTAHIFFDHPQRAVTLGQSIVFYKEDICLGGAVIRKVGRTFFEQGRALP